MIQRIVIGTVVSLLLTTSCNSQPNNGTSLNNKSFEYTLLRTMSKLLDSTNIELSKTVVITQLSDSIKKKLAKIKGQDWIKLLLNESTDWAANLYLYELYKRDGSYFQIIKSKKDWRKCCKEDDIDYWEKEFSKKPL
jgi:hypothetical protein